MFAVAADQRQPAPVALDGALQRQDQDEGEQGKEERLFQP